MENEDYLNNCIKSNPNRGLEGTIITLEILTRAISNHVGIYRDEVKKDAGFVMDYFGFDDRIIDNVLEPQDRQLFYILEEEGILYREGEVNTIDGREWRTHYWGLKKDNILKYATDEYMQKNKEKIIFEINKTDKIPSPEDFYKMYWEEEIPSEISYGEIPKGIPDPFVKTIP